MFERLNKFYSFAKSTIPLAKVLYLSTQSIIHMKAMILAAGLGTRLRPLTNDRPKAMVEIQGTPLLEIAIRRLIHFGCEDIIVNVHHFGDQIIQFLVEKNNFGINIAISDERAQLMNTGGGVKKAAHFFNDGAPFLLCNTDILSNIDLRKFYETHLDRGGIATLALRRRTTSRYLIFDQSALLHGWTNVKTGELRLPRPGSTQFQMWAFSGLHVIDPCLLEKMPSQKAFSIIDTYLSACQEGEIYGYPHDEDAWLDVGKPEMLSQASELYQILRKDWTKE